MDLLARYVAAHNEGVAGGGFGELAELFGSDGELSFLGVPAGPFRGAAAIRRAFEDAPPDDELVLLGRTYGWKRRPGAIAGWFALESRAGRIERLRVHAVPGVSLAPPDDIGVVRAMLLEYQRAIGVDLCFQGFARELAELPGDYAPPRGLLLLLRVAGAAAGCVAVRPLREGAEMKRLYLGREHRGRGLGRLLALAAIDGARAAGYRVLRLDTLPAMVEAAALYLSLGFREVAPPAEQPVAGMRYFELRW